MKPSLAEKMRRSARSIHKKEKGKEGNKNYINEEML